MQGGELHIHGKKRDKTWTNLHETAGVGNTTITLREKVLWEVGEEIMIGTTDFDWTNSEIRTIT